MTLVHFLLILSVSLQFVSPYCPSSPHSGLSLRPSSSLSRLFADSTLAETLLTAANSFSTPLLLSSVAAFGGAKFVGYTKFAFATAETINGIPPNFSVVEIDARDGKNVFYLPKGTDYTAVMELPNEADEERRTEKKKINEQLILESIGKANREGLQLRGKIRSQTQQIDSKSVDCVISTGAMSRSVRPTEDVVIEAFRMLRPGGLFVFVEPDASNQVISNVLKVFPEKITSATSAGAKAAKAKRKLESKDKVKKMGKKTKKRQSITDEIDAILNSSKSMEDVERIESEYDSNNKELIDTELVTSNEVIERPGISYQRDQNLLDPFVTGIAVRP